MVTLRAPLSFSASHYFFIFFYYYHGVDFHAGHPSLSPADGDKTVNDASRAPPNRFVRLERPTWTQLSPTHCAMHIRKESVLFR